MIYQKDFQIPTTGVDRYNRLKLSRVLHYLQEVAEDHGTMLGAGRDALAEKKLFWAIIRHRVQIIRLPRAGEKITVHTWPMPATRTAYPRASVATDGDGNELFRSVSLWILMDMESRTMVLPGKSGVQVEGLTVGNELALPNSLLPRQRSNEDLRTVRYTDLDWNGHMNNCRYLDWVCDLLPGDFHRERTAREFTLCYTSEAMENEKISLAWELDEMGQLRVDANRKKPGVSAGQERVFSAQVQY